MKLFRSALIAGLFLLPLSHASAAWIDWSSPYSGTLAVGDEVINVSLTGAPMNLVNGDYYFNNAATGYTSETGTYAGLAPADLIQVNQSSTFTLNFDQAIVDPYMALVSVGTPGYTITYNFEDSFEVISAGANYWGYGGYSVDGTNLLGREFNGVLQFTGSFDSITFTVQSPEYWHGFNFGTESIASVPEPSTMLLLSAGLLGITLVRRKSRI